MEMLVKKEEINCLRKILHICTKSEEMQDCVVPDTYPDIMQIVDICAELMIEQKQVSDGKASVSGNICTATLYTCEEGALHKLTAKIPFTLSVDCEKISLDTELVTKLTLLSSDVKVLNPRKVLVCAEIMGKFMAFNHETMQISTGVMGDDKIHTKIEQCSPSPIVEVSEKDFIITEELSMPPAPEGYAEILCKDVTFEVEDIKYVGSKMIFKGEAHICVLAQPNGKNTPVRFMSNCNFSQIIELGRVADNFNSKLVLSLISCDMEIAQDENAKPIVSVEMNILAQAVTCEGMEISYLADAYSNCGELSLETEQITLADAPEMTSLRETVRVLLETESTATEVIDISAVAVETYIEEGKLKSKLCIRTMYVNSDGKICGAQKIEDFEMDCEKAVDNCNISLTLGELYASITAGGIDVRFPIEIELAKFSDVEISMVTDVALQIPEQKNERPAMVIVPVSENIDIWELAKKHHSTVELIAEENPEMSDIIIIPIE